MKSPYEARRTNDKDEEGGEAPSDDDESSNSESDGNSDSRNNDYHSQYSGNDWGELPSDREYKDDGLYYEDYDDDVD